jgi:hypothetical protein
MSLERSASSVTSGGDIGRANPELTRQRWSARPHLPAHHLISLDGSGDHPKRITRHRCWIDRPLRLEAASPRRTRPISRAESATSIAISGVQGVLEGDERGHMALLPGCIGRDRVAAGRDRAFARVINVPKRRTWSASSGDLARFVVDESRSMASLPGRVGRALVRARSRRRRARPLIAATRLTSMASSGVTAALQHRQISLRRVASASPSATSPVDPGNA